VNSQARGARAASRRTAPPTGIQALGRLAVRAPRRVPVRGEDSRLASASPRAGPTSGGRRRGEDLPPAPPPPPRRPRRGVGEPEAERRQRSRPCGSAGFRRASLDRRRGSGWPRRGSARPRRRARRCAPPWSRRGRDVVDVEALGAWSSANKIAPHVPDPDCRAWPAGRREHFERVRRSLEAVESKRGRRRACRAGRRRSRSGRSSLKAESIDVG
jgi:hypothetical protein